jgi:hypothetical protein
MGSVPPNCWLGKGKEEASTKGYCVRNEEWTHSIIPMFMKYTKQLLCTWHSPGCWGIIAVKSHTLLTELARHPTAVKIDQGLPEGSSGRGGKKQ